MHKTINPTYRKTPKYNYYTQKYRAQAYSTN